ncbi:hypothetical protein VHEMI10440 [[Torrubiella] hemipterigena]|uniref:Cullin family profile domain-containing protein n=1 Tax=[Torrubiella] hemipterigena TaxID=1531966 RepID=A0A0A1TIR7_9HYPO|nr:hypothetical protein VHEMI10440 [[Torrubiella] hemipterigena]
MQHDADQTSPSRRRPRLPSSSSSPFTAKRPKFADEPSMVSPKAKGKLPAVADADGAGRPSAFQPHTGAKKLVIKNLRKPANREAQVEEYYQKTAAELDAALAAILSGTRPNAPLERLYRGVEDTCRRGRADAVYKLLNDHIIGHLQATVLKRIRQRGDTSNVKVLANVLDEWKIWNKQTVLIRSTFSFLDRTYLLRESLPSINDMAITQFRRMLFPSSSSTNQRPFEGDVVKGICDLIEADRRGNDARDPELLRDSIMMLYVLGVYTKHFEPVFLATSKGYFQECGTTWNMSNLRDHIDSCETLLQREDHRCMAFNIDSTTEKLLMQTAHTVLIEEYADKLLHKESLSQLLEDKDIRSMKGLYELLKLSNLQLRMKQPWGEYVRVTGASIIGDKEKGEEMVIRLLDLRRSLDLFIRDSFVKDDAFLYEMREAFAKFMNDRQIASCWNSGTSKIGEMTAKHVDMLLRGGLKALPKQLLSDVQDRATAEKEGLSSTGDEDAELDRQLDQALELFRFIEGKDAFEAFYKKDLARRLLMGRSASKDAERNMLTKLRGECGANFTHNLEQMFKDQDIAKDEMDSFREYNESLGEDKPSIDLQVMVLSAAAWPTYPDVPITVPAAVAKQMERFDGHYKSTHTGRALKWKHSLAHCSVKGVFPKGSKELLVSAFQAIVLLMFNRVGNDDALSYDEISEGTGLKDGDLERTLQSLACGKVRVLTKHPKGRDVKTTDTFTFNKTFSDPKYRVKINQIQLKETKEENKATHERIEQDRRFETQAAIVRVMKSRKTMGHSELVAEVINLTKKRGSVEPAAIKKEIESLIDKDYLEREGNTYTYQA